ncbi:VirD4-like conjugal transfer protein, CD1115 family [uncultured Clostridium sp.]|uniref:VirD4-like conjugal transfer protein, CD1115 family n=1 Tax=uncultured Clostridium sp. TaxID=59620 RepID=UPI0026F44AF9|nr:type IV secretory system conjugative DNA transfer family protein [uncultured Clostridium sp.]
MKFIEDLKEELQTLLDEKEANKEMKLIRKIADKKILSTAIIILFILITLFVNFISNSLDGLFLLSTGMEKKINLIWNILMPNLSYPLLYLLAYILAGAVLFKLVFNIKASFKDIREGQKGNSRFATQSEIREQYKSVPELESEMEQICGGYEGRGGVIVSREKDKIFLDDSPTNNLIIGTTRSGKGELFIFPTIDLYSRASIKSSLILNDPKGELYSASKETLEKRGYRVEVLNLLKPMNSMSYNPLQLIIDAYREKDYSTAQSLVKTLTYTLYYKPGSKDPFWQTSAMSLVNALILAVCDECIKSGDLHKITLYTVANMLSELGSKEDVTGKNELDNYFERLDSLSVAKMQYATSNFSKGSTRGGIFATAMSELQIFTMDEIAKLTSKNSINLKDIGFKNADDNKPIALFMVTPDYDCSNHVISSIFVRQLYYVLAKEASLKIGGKCDREVIFLLDEFGNMPSIEGMANIVTVCLGRNIRFNLVIQAISQLKKLYGDDYKTILGNCSNKFYIFTNEVETAEEFCKILGDKTIITYSRSGEILDTTKHQTESVDARKLLTVDELMHLEEGEIVLARGTKRSDLNGNKIRPFPIFNTGENKLKYRYEYLKDYFDTSKNLINEKVDTLHSNVNLKDLLLNQNENKEKILESIETKEIEETEIKVDNSIVKEENEILINEIFTIDEFYSINKMIEATPTDGGKIKLDMKWSDVENILKQYDKKYFGKYITLGEDRIKMLNDKC